MSPPRSWYGPILAGIVNVVAIFTVLVGTGTHASAAPSLGEIEKQIDDEWNKLEPTIERYNEVHGQLRENQAKVANLTKQLQPLQLQVELALARVSDLAARSYKTGQASTFNALLSGGSPEEFMSRLTLVNHIARIERARVADVVVLRDRFAGDKKALDDLVGKLSAQDTELANKKKAIEVQITSLQKLRQQAYGTSGVVGTLKPVACPVEYIGGGAGKAITKACSLIGKPYVWGGSGPNGYDCSGLTQAAWAAAGVSLYHYTGAQWKSTQPVSRADIRPGDLVFFYSDLHHVGIYAGGDWMVHAPTTGDFVRMAKIDRFPIAGFRRPG